MKNTLNTALLPFACAALMLVHCAKGGDTETISDEAAVMQAKENLGIGYASGDHSGSVTGNTTLLLTGANGVSIAWESDDNDVIDVETTAGTGTVTRSRVMNTLVTLTATLTKNAARDTKTFALTVVITDAGAVALAKNALMITYASGESDSRVTKNITLPLTGLNGVSIAWASGNAAINVEMTAGTGMVTRPGSGESNASVTLTARLTKNEASDTREFMLTILVQPANDAAAILQAKENLEIGYASDESASRVTENITLPTMGLNEVEIEWASDDDDVIDVEMTAGAGTVTRARHANTAVTLTATLTKGSESDTSEFMLTVPSLFAWSQVALAEGSSIWERRSDHVAVALNSKIWVLGGYMNTTSVSSSGVGVNDVWSSGDGATWAQTTVMGTHWSARGGHDAVVFNGKMWVVGGFLYNDAWSSSDGTTWTNANASGHWSARSDHIVVVLGSKMWVVGGVRLADLDDVWSSSDGATWMNANARGPVIDPDADPVQYHPHWSTRSTHAAVVFNEKIWVLGGSGRDRENDVWSSSDGTDWAETTVTGTHWSARDDHAAVVFDNKMWVLGGNDGSNTLNDVWWSSDGASWTKLTNGTSHWSARRGHAVVVLGDKMFLMGGWTGSAALNDVWVYQETN